MHAAILAAAGLHRLDVSQRITAYLDAPHWLPAAGQGAIAIQIRSDDDETRAVFAPLGDRETMIDTTRRACVPRRARGRMSGADRRARRGGERHRTRCSADSSPMSKASDRCAARSPLDVGQPELTGVRLANELRHRGASEILDSLRRAEHLPAPQPE